MSAGTVVQFKIGIAGLGAIGQALARRLDKGEIPGCQLAAVSGRDPAKTAAFIAGLSTPVASVALGELASHADIVVECAPSALLREIVLPAVQAGKKVIVLSVGALLAHPDLMSGAAGPGQIMVPTGALIGLDAVTAAAVGKIHSVRMVTRKPPLGLLGAPYLVQHGIEVAGLTAPLKVFDGSAREAAVGFPANLNVAVALSLAGIGPDKTMLEIWADPTVVRNTHTITVDSDSAKFTMTIENIPSENPKTGLITAQSIVAMLRKLATPVRIGT
ncbi:aspartate dehydrogenase [Lacisediminimonas sp.]|uniref:aspartate dehydrogenase n=1 Tax=Lacisediminimonas sp. TaxID=3060582 RepID=UPI0027240340|nr:aspartate dehydrogenase [Lacisediminimonas sp.]MDO8300286.1 aspartate dehydrogenase [Lacisediminimonas sp.]MDO9216291.1 aspartate dehydrogenase [Lacisediminimonas sp.]